MPTKRDPVRTMKLRIAVRYLLDRDGLINGNQSRLAEHFKVSRQRVHQIVVEERQRDHQIVAGERQRDHQIVGDHQRDHHQVAAAG